MALRLGTVTTIVASSADAAIDFLQLHDAAFSGRSLLDSAHVFAHYTHSMGWLPTSSPRWHSLRKVCSAELFAPHSLDTQQSLRLRRDKVRRPAARLPCRAAGARGRACRRQPPGLRDRSQPALLHHLLHRPR